MSIFDCGYYVNTLSVKNCRHYYQSFLFIKFEPKSWTGIWYTCYQFTPALQPFILIAKFFNTRLQFTVIRHSEYNFFIKIFHVYSKLKQVKLTFSQLALWYFLYQFQNQEKKWDWQIKEMRSWRNKNVGESWTVKFTPIDVN